MQSGVMGAVLVREVGAYELTESPVPAPGPGEALIRVSVTGLCRADLKPAAAAAGPEGAAARTCSVAFGDRVHVYPGVWCGASLCDLEHGLDIVARRTGRKVHLFPDRALIPERSFW